jgi:hypothetical protein
VAEELGVVMGRIPARRASAKKLPIRQELIMDFEARAKTQGLIIELPHRVVPNRGKSEWERCLDTRRF